MPRYRPEETYRWPRAQRTGRGGALQTRALLTSRCSAWPSRLLMGKRSSCLAEGMALKPPLGHLSPRFREEGTNEPPCGHGSMGLLPFTLRQHQWGAGSMAGLRDQRQLLQACAQGEGRRVGELRTPRNMTPRAALLGIRGLSGHLQSEGCYGSSQQHGCCCCCELPTSQAHWYHPTDGLTTSGVAAGSWAELRAGRAGEPRSGGPGPNLAAETHLP